MTESCNSWTVRVEVDPATGDLMLPLPANLLDIKGWKVGDTLIWGQDTEGSWKLSDMRELCNDMLLAIIGSDELVKAWWTTPNFSFNLHSPNACDLSRVYAYLLNKTQ